MTIFMKIYSTFIYLYFSLVTLTPALSHAQVTLPVWLQPNWIKAKLSDSPVKNADNNDLAQPNVVTNHGTANPQVKLLPVKPIISMAPVETAVPKINEKHLSPEELKELRRQLRQQN